MSALAKPAAIKPSNSTSIRKPASKTPSSTKLGSAVGVNTTIYSSYDTEGKEEKPVRQSLLKRASKPKPTPATITTTSLEAKPRPRLATSSSNAASTASSSSGSSTSSSSASDSKSASSSTSLSLSSSTTSARRIQSISKHRFDSHQPADPFSSSSSSKTKFKTGFSQAYSSGGVIPCRVHSGNAFLKLSWDCPLHDIDYGIVLTLCAEGICETQHPYHFVARQGFDELVSSAGSLEKVLPLLSQLVLSLRKSLIDRAPGVFGAGVTGLMQLSECVGPNLNAHLGVLLAQLNKQNKSKDSELITKCIHVLASNGGTEAVKMIKSKIPTFQ